MMVACTRIIPTVTTNITMKKLFSLLLILCLYEGHTQITEIKDVYIEGLSVERETSDSVYFALKAEVTKPGFNVWEMITQKGDSIWVKGELSSENSTKVILKFQLSSEQFKQFKSQQITHLVDCPRNGVLRIANKKKIKLKKEVDQPLVDQAMFHGYGIYGRNYYNNADSTLHFIKLSLSPIYEERSIPRIGLSLSNGNIIVLDKVGKDFITPQTFRYKGSPRSSRSNQFILHLTVDTLEELGASAIEQILIYREDEIREIEVVNQQVLSKAAE